MSSYRPLDLSTKITDILNSEFYKKLRVQSKSNIEIRGCHKCYEQERAGITSLREVANNKYPKVKSNSNIININDVEYLEIFLGNTCNLKCLTCNPQLSTSWIADYSNLGWDFKKKEDIKINFSFDKLKKVKDIKFVGGEPLIAPEHRRLLDELSMMDPAKKSLTYFTNVTKFPKANVLEQWKKFKKVNIWLSIDGVGKVNEYIRYPSRWSDVVENTKKYIELSSVFSSIKLSIMTTVSVYSIWSLNQLEDWFEEINYLKNINFMHFNPLVSPTQLSILNLSPNLRFKAISKLNEKSYKQNKIINYLNKNKFLNKKQDLINYTTSLDKLRGVSINDYIPDLSDIIN